MLVWQAKLTVFFIAVFVFGHAAAMASHPMMTEDHTVECQVECVLHGSEDLLSYGDGTVLPRVMKPKEILIVLPLVGKEQKPEGHVFRPPIVPLLAFVKRE